MLSNRFIFTINAIFFTLGLLILFLYNLQQEPILSKDFHKFIGDIIVTQGKVVNISRTVNNNTKIQLCDDYGCFYVIVFQKHSMIDCKSLKVKGKLDYYMGNYYIFVFKNSDIKCYK